MYLGLRGLLLPLFSASRPCRTPFLSPSAGGMRTGDAPHDAGPRRGSGLVAPAVLQTPGGVLRLEARKRLVGDQLDAGVDVAGVRNLRLGAVLGEGNRGVDPGDGHLR